MSKSEGEINGEEVNEGPAVNDGFSDIDCIADTLEDELKLSDDVADTTDDTDACGDVVADSE